ncbi:MAG: histidine kinase N-terminal 7TM domain-containing protein [Candidatus Omnitrophota bacterium]
MISYYSIFPGVTAVSVLIIGVYAYFRNAGKMLNKLFLFVCANVFIWLIGYSAVYSCETVKAALFWARFSYIGIVFIATANLHFVLVLSGADKKMKKVIAFAYIFSFVYLFLSRTDFFIDGMNHFFWGYYPRVSYAYYPFIVIFYGIYMLIPFFCTSISGVNGKV